MPLPRPQQTQGLRKGLVLGALKWGRDGKKKRGRGGSRVLYLAKRHLCLGLRFFLDPSLVPRGADLESFPLSLTHMLRAMGSH